MGYTGASLMMNPHSMKMISIGMYDKPTPVRKGEGASFPVNFAPFKNELDHVDSVVYGGHMFGSVGTI